MVGTWQGKPLLSSILQLLASLSLYLSISLSLHASFYQFLELPSSIIVFSSTCLSLAWFSFPVLALIMNLNESFWQNSKKKRKEIPRKRNLNHSLIQAGYACKRCLQRWPTPRVHISTASLITRSCWQCHVTARLSVARRHVMSKTASRTGARVLLPVLWRSESQLHPWKRLQDHWYFFSKPAARPSLKTPARRLQDVTVARRTCASKTLERKEGVPRWNQCWTLWARQIGASSAWLFARLECLRRTLPILRGSDRDPGRQTGTYECEPCVIILALRSWNSKRSGSFDQTSCLWSSRSLSLSSSFTSFFLFFLFHFYIF